MKKAFNQLFGAVLAVSSLSLITAPALAESYYDTLKDFLTDNMPGEAMLPTPYGADSRFRPKTIWIYLDEYQARPTKPKRQNAWIVASSGEAVYSGVSVTSNPINLPTRNATKNRKFAVTAALSGTVSEDEFQAALDLANSENVDLVIDLGETAIEYVNYFDMLLAQEQNKDRLDSLNALLKKRYGKDTPRRRIITAALKVKGAKVTVDSTKAKSISAKLTAFLSSLGFSYNKDTKTFDSLMLNDWRYIGYSARYTNQFGLISGGEDPNPDVSQQANVPLDENVEW